MQMGEFLFQIGAIRSDTAKIDVYEITKFLFQIGAIRSELIVDTDHKWLLISIPNWCD